MNLAIDLDGTLAEWERGNEELIGVGDWLPDAKLALHAVMDAGYAVIIHTCRAHWAKGGGLEAVMQFLRSGGFDPVEVTDSWGFQAGKIGVWVGEGKPVATAYIDDRGVHYKGDWMATLNELQDRFGPA